MRNFRKKIFPVLRKLRKKIAQNRAKLIAFHAQRKSSQKKILRKRFSHFVETLDTPYIKSILMDIRGIGYVKTARAELSTPVAVFLLCLYRYLYYLLKQISLQITTK